MQKNGKKTCNITTTPNIWGANVCLFMWHLTLLAPQVVSFWEWKMKWVSNKKRKRFKYCQGRNGSVFGYRIVWIFSMIFPAQDCVTCDLSKKKMTVTLTYLVYCGPLCAQAAHKRSAAQCTLCLHGRNKGRSVALPAGPLATNASEQASVRSTERPAETTCKMLYQSGTFFFL